ncbi:MAG: ATP synthase F1 subunit epsilon [Planctomycetota bacterium]
MQVKVVTPDASYFDGEAEAVFLPAWDGEIGVLPRHAPLIARLGHGVARVTTKGEQSVRVAVYGGFVKVQDDVVTVLAGGAAKPQGDKAAAQKALDAAQGELTKAREAGLPAAEVAGLEERVRRARAFVQLLAH